MFSFALMAQETFQMTPGHSETHVILRTEGISTLEDVRHTVPAFVPRHTELVCLRGRTSGV